MESQGAMNVIAVIKRPRWRNSLADFFMRS